MNELALLREVFNMTILGEEAIGYLSVHKRGLYWSMSSYHEQEMFLHHSSVNSNEKLPE